MNFLSFAHALMGLQKVVPDMHWHIEDRTADRDLIIVTLPVPKEIGTLLKQGRQLFS